MPTPLVNEEEQRRVREEKRQQCRAAAEARRVEERLSDETAEGSRKRNRSEAEDPLIHSHEDAQALQALPDHLHIQVLEDRFEQPSTERASAQTGKDKDRHNGSGHRQDPTTITTSMGTEVQDREDESDWFKDHTATTISTGAES